MRIYLAECEIHVEVPNQGSVDIQKHLPLTAKDEIDKDTLRILDQIAYRFAKLRDTMGKKTSHFPPAVKGWCKLGPQALSFAVVR